MPLSSLSIAAQAPHAFGYCRDSHFRIRAGALAVAEVVVVAAVVAATENYG